jgi:hypothetical protein
MITLSILEVNATIAKSQAALRIIHVLQMYLVPVLALAMIAFVIVSASHDLTAGDALRGLWR